MFVILYTAAKVTDFSIEMITNHYPKSAPKKILVIDSGVGGLSITENIRARSPEINVFYIADRAQFPYGSKREDEVSSRIHKLVAYGIHYCNPDLVVIACNTASTVALDSLRNQFNIPFVGVVPAIKPAVAQSRSGVIGILATEGTVNRAYTKNLIESFAKNNQVHLYGSSILVEQAENKLKGLAIDIDRIKSDVNRLVHQNTAMDTVVLACTHFPLLRAELADIFPQIHDWVDSGAAIARRVEHLLDTCSEPITQEFASAPNNALAINQFIVTGKVKVDYKSELISALLGNFEAKIIDI